MSKTFFTVKELHDYRRRIHSLIDRLNVQELRGEALRPVGFESAEGSAGPAAQESDLGNRDAEESRAIALLGHEEQVLAEAAAALDRIEAGSFGRCQDCGRPIARDRLNALLYVRRCIHCERLAEAEA